MGEMSTPPKATVFSGVTQSTSQASPHCHAFLEVVLDNVCCAANVRSDSTNSIENSGYGAYDNGGQCDDVTCGAAGFGRAIRMGGKEAERRRQLLADAELAMKRLKNSDENAFRPLAEVILPHLRFQPLPQLTTASKPSSRHRAPFSTLDDFYNLFLGDNAPHSFGKFHSTVNNDENVAVTRWKGSDNSPARSSNYLERTITFQTGISSSSNSGSLDSSNISLGVTAEQKLYRLPQQLILECEFSFDFSDVGGRLLPTFLISNECRSSTVVGRVILVEGEDALLTGDKDDPDGGLASSYLNCFSHPLLLPPEGICGVRGRRNSDTTYVVSSNSFTDATEEATPAHIGATLLNAINAKNAPTERDWSNSFENGENRLMEAENLSPSMDNDDCAELNSRGPNNSQAVHRRRRNKAQEDVLACSSRGSLKMKHITSFENTRSFTSASEGQMAMRRIILEKDGAEIKNQSRRHSHQEEGDTSEPQKFSARQRPLKMPTGFSMRIEMEVRSPPASTSSSIHSLSSFSRSKGSFSGIDDKVRKGLKKRVSRTWISWAESWCMRLWLEEEGERQKRNLSPSPIRKRSKTNVRPNVRRLSKPETSRDAGNGNANGFNVVIEPTFSQSSSPNPWHTVSGDEGSRSDDGDAFRWKFVENGTGPELPAIEDLDGDDECGVEVDFPVSSPGVSRAESQIEQRDLSIPIIPENAESFESSKAPSLEGKKRSKTKRWKSIGSKHLKLKKPQLIPT